jgi:formate hydrogenlyase subunit 4
MSLSSLLDLPLGNVVGSILQVLLVVAVAPALQGWIKCTKATWQGRAGPPLLQPYADLGKLLRKESLVPEPASWIFRWAPWLVLGATLTAVTLVPLVALRGPLGAGDVVALAGLLALARFAQALAALDTGSTFAGMGASREMAIAALVEPALVATVFALAIPIGTTDAGGLAEAGLAAGWGALGPAHLLALAALLVVAIAETGRIPVDNPDTHLELTMVHEGMLLEYSGPHLAALQLAAIAKQMLVLGLVGALLLPWGLGAPWPIAVAALILKLGVLGLFLATIESLYAKLRILRLPDLLATAFALGGLSLVARGVFGA